ncbi:MAG: cob(I)yrinic acid a,c-diamide adenosyltransferase [Lachnospiraceae bacterium]|nr:cob(I)yrinic acid a,c-diamide adenosyltransferase [Lachnospiraceae bacterium]MDD5853577.1 cob(I)yrinic acid a,c-diamide adenosyltransferase [Lachnospiraceae bacterium]
MKNGKIHIYTGDGHGKTPAALGEALYAASAGKQVVVIQFMKGKGIFENDYVKRLEPEIKFFCFEKTESEYVDLNDEQRAEENINIRNGFNFAKKVLSTNGCDLLILDEILGVLDVGVITVEDLKGLLEAKSDETTIIMTGIQLKDEVVSLVDEISKIESMPIA